LFSIRCEEFGHSGIIAAGAELALFPCSDAACCARRALFVWFYMNDETLCSVPDTNQSTSVDLGDRESLRSDSGSELRGDHVLVAADFHDEGAKEAVAVQHEIRGQRVVLADTVSASEIEWIRI